MRSLHFFHLLTILVLLPTVACVPQDTALYPAYQQFQSARRELDQAKQSHLQAENDQNAANQILTQMESQAEPALQHEALQRFLDPALKLLGITLMLFVLLAITAVSVYGRVLGPGVRRFLRTLFKRIHRWHETKNLHQLARKLIQTLPPGVTRPKL